VSRVEEIDIPDYWAGFVGASSKLFPARPLVKRKTFWGRLRYRFITRAQWWFCGHNPFRGRGDDEEE